MELTIKFENGQALAAQGSAELQPIERSQLFSLIKKLYHESSISRGAGELSLAADDGTKERPKLSK